MYWIGQFQIGYKILGLFSGSIKSIKKIIFDNR